MLTLIVSIKCLSFCSSGIANRAIRPTIGIVDPLHTRFMPERVAANSGFDVLW
jgi:alcohol dehydrogenase class IV